MSVCSDGEFEGEEDEEEDEDEDDEDEEGEDAEEAPGIMSKLAGMASGVMAAFSSATPCAPPAERVFGHLPFAICVPFSTHHLPSDAHHCLPF